MRRNGRFRSKLRLLPQNWVSPAIFGVAGWLIFPSVASHADLATMLAGLDNDRESWRMVLTNSPAGSIHQAELAFADPASTGSIAAGAGMVLPDGRKVAFVSGEKGNDGTPDEDRVNRNAKKGRVIAVEKVQPPKDFSAGSILERTRLLFRPVFDLKDKSAFVKPSIKGKEIEIATAFYKTQPAPQGDTAVPAILASLVTSNKADVLATAYASAAPDYSRQSPFDSILTDKNEGRFAPQIGPRDHAWAASILPPSVFSAREQQCLASGIYFEARGRIREGAGGRRSGHSQPRPQPSLSQDYLRRRLPERRLAQSLPVFLRLRQHQGPCEFAVSLARRPRCCHGRDRRQDLAAASGVGHSLPCRLRPAELGQDHGKGRPHRHACLLPHLWWWLELRQKGGRLPIFRRPAPFEDGFFR